MGRYLLFALVLPICALTAAEREQSLTGEYAASLSFGRNAHVRIVYQVTVRDRGLLSLGPGSRMLLSGDPETPDKGQSGLIVYGAFDAAGTGKDPVEVTGLNEARIKIGSTEHRDDLKKKAVPTRIRIGYTVFRNIRVEISNGMLDIHECVFIDSPVVIDGGAASLSNCTLLNTKGHALQVLRSDTYPNVSLKYLEFVRSPLGLSIRKDTVRDQRGQLMIGGCSFVKNEKDVFYDEVQHMLLQGCYFDGADAKNVQERLEYPDNADRPGRILAQGVLREPPKQAGAKLIKEGVIKLPEPAEENEDNGEKAEGKADG